MFLFCIPIVGFTVIINRKQIVGHAKHYIFIVLPICFADWNSYSHFLSTQTIIILTKLTNLGKKTKPNVLVFKKNNFRNSFQVYSTCTKNHTLHINNSK